MKPIKIELLECDIDVEDGERFKAGWSISGIPVYLYCEVDVKYREKERGLYEASSITSYYITDRKGYDKPDIKRRSKLICRREFSDDSPFQGMICVLLEMCGVEVNYKDFCPTISCAGIVTAVTYPFTCVGIDVRDMENVLNKADRRNGWDNTHMILRNEYPSVMELERIGFRKDENDVWGCKEEHYHPERYEEFIRFGTHEGYYKEYTTDNIMQFSDYAR